MSDRVSRLAKLRRKRDAGTAHSLGGTSASLPSTHGECGNSSNQSQRAVADETSPGVEIETDLPIEDKQTEEESSVKSEGAKEQAQPLTYNSDLKKDLAMLLNKATAETERSLNEIMWKAYVDDQAD